MVTLVFATHNAHKVAEIQAAIGHQLKVVSLKEAGITQEIPEPHPTLEGNAREKSQTIYQLTGQNCFSEDTGLEVDALQGAPGVKSARYAGEKASFTENVVKLLSEMKDRSERRARFRTVVSLIWEGQEVQFEGICEGQIIQEARGTEGFGYDPVFQPEGSEKTFAEMSLEEKNRFSHRKKAAAKLVTFLQEKLKSN